VAAGYSNRQIARRLEVSETTVRTHLENIFARLEVNSRTAAVARLGQPMLAAEG
jgi:ATP/maltotriose-dependent transcriptional regulator MalT